MNIYLIGMMGSGKTTLAEAISEISQYRFLDLDEVIVSDSGKSIGEIFAERGEDFFREMESSVLFDIHHIDNLVVATGGGIVLQPRNIAMMEESGIIVYVDRDVDDIIATIDAASRPLLAQNPENVRQIYEKRRPLYEDAAMVTVRNDAPVEEVARRIVDVSELFTL